MKNPTIAALAQELRKTSIEQDVTLWKRVADDLERPTRQRRTVNVFGIDAHARSGETVVVPGKVLGEGDLTKSVTVAAFAFSDGAREKINKAGKALSIRDLLRTNPKAAKVRLLG